MPKLPFMQELAEARLFRTPDQVKGRTAEDIAFTIYIMILTLQIFRHVAPSEAKSYASETLRYNDYNNVFYSATDLGNLISVLNNQDLFDSRIKINKNLSVPIFLINQFLRETQSNKPRYNDDASFLYKLEQFLKLYSNSTARILRRDVTDWDKLTRVDKIRVDRILRTELEKRCPGSDMHVYYKQYVRIDQLREYVEDKPFNSGLSYHRELNPAFWDEGANLDREVKGALDKIAAKFLEFVDVERFRVVDVIITGSNCAFNYTSQSDVDLHVLIDSSAVGEDNPLTEPFLQAKKSLWNSGHDITVRGFDVELYAEDVTNTENQLVATGIYSLMKDEWIKKPSYVEVTFDDAAVKAKSIDIMQQIDYVIDNKVDDFDELDDLWQKIRKMRRNGLETGGEFSVENLTFKAVRNNGYFDKLRNYQRQLEDEGLTLENQDFLQLG